MKREMWFLCRYIYRVEQRCDIFNRESNYVVLIFVRQISFFRKALSSADVQSLYDNRGACSP